MSAPGLSVFVITHNTKDFGPLYVVRESRVWPYGANGKVPEGFALDDDDLLCKAIWPLCMVPSLEEAREAIQKVRPGLVCMTRCPNDDPVIVETWL